MTVLAGDEVAAVVGQSVADGGQSDVVVGGHTVAAVGGQCKAAVGGQTVTAVGGQCVLAGRELGNAAIGGQSDTAGSDVAGSEDSAVGLELASEVIVFKVTMLSAKLELLKVGAVAAGGRI